LVDINKELAQERKDRAK
jgi:hypothetical protein